ncbi:MAG: polyamine aminopropyltransferase [archaeon GB-1867-005]|nr:polyamine aminopropyltransferase [Candidatus Culexmicrobium cathedralense]
MMKIKSGLTEIDGELFYLEPMTPNAHTVERVKSIVYSGKSKYQLIEVIESYDFGLALHLDHSTQICEKDEHIYHESFVHPVMISHPCPRKILIIGGGDGGALREVLKHPTVEKAVLVEIDEEVIRVVKKYMPFVPQGAFEDPRAQIVIEDGLKYVKEVNEEFDVIFMDVTDDIGPAVPLYTVDFYKITKDILSEEGILVTQALGLQQHPGALRKITSDFKKLFKIVDFYAVYIPSFANQWAFAFGSDKHNAMSMTLEEVSERFSERNLRTKFYTPKVHIALQYLRETLKDYLEH